MILAPLRGVTIRCFRRVFADEIRSAGFTEAVTPFISANEGVDPLRDRELRGGTGDEPVRLTPQFIGKSPAALRACLVRIREAGYETADLNCGCPYPMVRNKGRGSGLLRTPEVLERLVSVGCEVMGPGRFSVKARLGVTRRDELLALLPMLNAYPLRFLTVHARTAVQMYGGDCDAAALADVARAARMPLVVNGDLPLPLPEGVAADRAMVGRAFVRGLGRRPDIAGLLRNYAEASRAELGGAPPVLGRLKELLAYFADQPAWRRKWQLAKVCRSLDELLSVIGSVGCDFLK